MSQSSATKTILITSASSGIGAALAKHYAMPGRTLALHGRNAERSGTVAEVCKQNGAETIIGSIDVTDREAMAAWITETDQKKPLGSRFRFGCI